MTTRLRLHRGENEGSALGEPGNIKFPSAKIRSRLVAGRVDRDPVTGVQEETTPRLTLHTDDGERPIASGELIAQIERTLERIQTRLDRVKEEVDRPFKFPDRDDGEWPPRAA